VLRVLKDLLALLDLRALTEQLDPPVRLALQD